MILRSLLLSLTLATFLPLHASTESASTPAQPRRPLQLELDGRWIGHGVSFSPYRDGQEPGGAQPSDAELLEDLRLVARYWNWIRTYDSTALAERTLALIRREQLPLRVMLGVWIVPDTQPADREKNRVEIAAAIRLANAYSDIVNAVAVGNEACVAWSAYRTTPEAIIGHIRTVRTAVPQPVTSADDYKFWTTAESEPVSAELDFITLHAYALWNGQPLDTAMEWTDGIYRQVVARHAGVPVIFGETGWATQNDRTRTQSWEEGSLMKAEASVAAQEKYLRQHYAWVQRTRVPTFLFEAFDENWKGGGAKVSPAAAEKHWGVFGVDRHPKESFRQIIREFHPAAVP